MTADPYAFLSPAAAAPAGSHSPVMRTPMERAHLAAGAVLVERDGWRLAVYEAEPSDPWLADLSHLGKLDVRAAATEVDELTGRLEPHRAREDGGVWTLRLTATRALVICPFARVSELRERIGPAAIDVTSNWAAVALGGDSRREVMQRSSGLDLREQRFGAGSCLQGSVMRVSTIVLDRGADFVMLIGWEFGEYFWEAILDAGVNLGIAPVTAPAVPAEVAA